MFLLKTLWILSSNNHGIIGEIPSMHLAYMLMLQTGSVRCNLGGKYEGCNLGGKFRRCNLHGRSEMCFAW